MKNGAFDDDDDDDDADDDDDGGYVRPSTPPITPNIWGEMVQC